MTLRLLAAGALTAAAYIVAAQIGFRAAFVAAQITTVWAPTGIAMAALLLGGVRLWPAIWTGAFLANAAGHAPLWTAPVIASGNTLEALAAAWALQRIPGFDIGLRRVGDVLAFIGIAAAGCTTLSATVGVATLCGAGVQPWTRFPELWLNWWLGDAIGALVVAPALLTSLRPPVASAFRRKHREPRAEAARAAAFTAASLVVTHLAFGPALELGVYRLEFVVFPLVIAAAVVGGPVATAPSVLAASAVAVWHTLRGSGPFAGPDVHASLVLLQAFTALLAATALLLAAAIAERSLAERRAREAAATLGQREEMLRLAQQAGGVATFEWDFRNQVATCSAEFFRIFGLPAREGVMRGEEWGRFVHPDDRERMAVHLSRALEGLEPAAADYRINAADGGVRWLTYAGRMQQTSEGTRLLGTVVDITDRKRLEADLRHHVAEVERILESIGEGFVAVDRDFRYVYVNRTAEDMLGRPRTELIGRTPWDVFPAEAVREFGQQLEAAMQSGEPQRHELHVPVWKRWFDTRVYPTVTGLSIFFVDVTARVETEIALRESRDVLSLAMRGGAMGAWSRNIATNEVWWSRELEEIVGLPPGAFDRTEAGFFGFVHDDDRVAVRDAVDRAVARRTDYIVEFRFRDAGGEWRWMEGRGRAVYADDGTPLSLYGIGIDVTARKQAEMALREAKAAAEERQAELADVNRELRRRVLEQQTLLDVLPIGIGIAADPECRHIRTNRAFAATLGLPLDSNASKTAPDHERPSNFRVLASDGRELPANELPMQVAAREGREVAGIELDVVHADGRIVRLLEYAAPLIDEHGVPRGSVGAFVDVTDAHRARATLARSEERYRRIFDTAGVSLWEQDFSAVKAALDELKRGGLLDVEAHLRSHPEFVDECIKRVRIVDVNRVTLRMFRAPEKRVLIESLERIFTPETRSVFMGELVALARGERAFESEAAVRTLDGRPLHVLVNVTFPEPGDSFDSVLVSLADITDRKVAETALRQEVDVRTALAHVGASLAGELRSDKLVQAVTDAATMLTEAEFGAFFYNVTDEKGDAYSLYALAGAPKEAFATFPHPRATKVFGPTFRGESIMRLDDVTKDPRFGQNAPFYGMPKGHLPVRSYLAVPVIGRGGLVLGGLFFGHSQAGMFRERHEMLASGVAAWAAIALDNSRLYQAVEEANRLKDEFLATLSHELRTPLNAVLGWAHMLRQGTMQPAMREKALESLERNARAQAQLVEDLLDVSRVMAGKLQISADAVDLGTVVAHAVDTVRAGVSAKRLHLHVHVPQDRRLIVTGDADRLQQIVWNLVSNAIKFTPEGGSVDVALRQVDAGAEIAVRDTGQGIEPAFQRLLFQRFRQVDSSQTRAHGGLGLGLSIVRHLTEAHGGNVTVESEGAGRGATFRVTLPLRAVHPMPQMVKADDDISTEGILSGVRVAVVDGDADARELMRYVLESRAAHVVGAGSAGEALHVLSSQPFDVLIADIGAPPQDGLALIRLLRGLPPQSTNRDVAAIALTAYVGPRERNEALEAGFGWHLAKPVDPEQLVVAVAIASGREGRSEGL